MERHTQMCAHTHSRRHAACANTPLIRYSDLSALASKGKLPGMTGSFQAAFHQFLRVCGQFGAGLTWGNCVKWSVRPGILTSINTVLLSVWKEHNLCHLRAGFNLLYVLLPLPDDNIIITQAKKKMFSSLEKKKKFSINFTIIMSSVDCEQLIPAQRYSQFCRESCPGGCPGFWLFSVGISRWLKTVINLVWCALLSLIEYFLWIVGIFQPKKKLFDHLHTLM